MSLVVLQKKLSMLKDLVKPILANYPNSLMNNIAIRCTDMCMEICMNRIVIVNRINKVMFYH